MADKTEIETNESPGTNGFSPVYAGFRQVENLIERMAEEGGVPARVDRSYLSNLPGSSQTILIASLKSLGLVDQQARPSKTLLDLVERPEDRALILNGVLREKYGRVLELDPNATQQQLEEAFREYGVTGSTMRKAIAFFLAAARFADVPLSPHFRTPKPTAGTRPRKQRERKGGHADEADNRAETGDESKRKRTTESNLPTLVQGLVEKLPPEGAQWDKDAASQWLALARLTFEYVYGLKLDPNEKTGGESSR
jgi:Family of unknown function (DUF5343)